MHPIMYPLDSYHTGKKISTGSYGMKEGFGGNAFSIPPSN